MRSCIAHHRGSPTQLPGYARLGVWLDSSQGSGSPEHNRRTYVHFYLGFSRTTQLAMQLVNSVVSSISQNSNFPVRNNVARRWQNSYDRMHALT